MKRNALKQHSQHFEFRGAKTSYYTAGHLHTLSALKGQARSMGLGATWHYYIKLWRSRSSPL